MEETDQRSDMAGSYESDQGTNEEKEEIKPLNFNLPRALIDMV